MHCYFVFSAFQERRKPRWYFGEFTGRFWRRFL